MGNTDENTKAIKETLRIIWRLGVVSNSQVSRLLGVSTSTAYRRLGELKEAGHIDSMRGGTQSRELAFTLTPSGAAWLNEQIKSEVDTTVQVTVNSNGSVGYYLGLSEIITLLALAARQQGIQFQWLRGLLPVQFTPDKVGILVGPKRRQMVFVEWFEEGGSIDDIIMAYIDLYLRPDDWQIVVRRFPPILVVIDRGLASFQTQLLATMLKKGVTTTDVTVLLSELTDIDKLGIFNSVCFRLTSEGLSGPASLLDFLE